LGSRLSSRSTVEHLRNSFKDPASPFYLAPGTQGPSSPGELFESDATLRKGVLFERDPHLNPASAEHARQIAMANGYDPHSFWEQPVVWGDLDSFRHVNNVHFLRYLESSRIHWMRSWREELGDVWARDILSGKGVGVILKSIDLKFRRPALYPDTLLISHKPHSPTPTSFGCKAIIQSYGQGKIVAESDSVLVWYDYDNLRKCEPPSELSQLIIKRMNSRK